MTRRLLSFEGPATHERDYFVSSAPVEPLAFSLMFHPNAFAMAMAPLTDRDVSRMDILYGYRAYGVSRSRRQQARRNQLRRRRVRQKCGAR